MADEVSTGVTTEDEFTSALARVRASWDAFGRTDPLWAILTNPDRRGGKWDTEEFFATGQETIRWLLEVLDGTGIQVRPERALDFGCGAGRLTQPLCDHFASADGVDIASSMIGLAREHNRHGDRCRYHVNNASDLRLFEDDTFDLVLSLIVLQHIDPSLGRRYIAEFVRVLRRGGIAVFQVPSEHHPEEVRHLPDSGHLAAIELAVTALEVEPASRVVLDVTVINRSPVAWPFGPGIRLGNHWLDTGGRTLVFDDGRVSLHDDVPPGGETALRLVALAPSSPGTYLLELDLVEEGVTWFAGRGSPTLRVSVVVGSPAGRLRRRLHLHLPTSRSAASRPVTTTPPDPGVDAVMEMHCIPVHEVTAVVTAAGGRVVSAERVSMTGSAWESRLYVVTKDEAATAN